MGGNRVAIEKAREGSVNDEIIMEGFGKEQRYPTRERQRLGEWWRNHILPQYGEETAIVAMFIAPLSWSKTFLNNI